MNRDRYRVINRDLILYIIKITGRGFVLFISQGIEVLPDVLLHFNLKGVKAINNMESINIDGIINILSR